VPEDNGSGSFTHTAAAVITALIWIGGAFAAAGAIWGAALGISVAFTTVVGLAVGAIPAVVSGIAVGSQISAERRRQMTAAASARWAPIALLIAIIGGIVWGVRAAF
jgi:hypothetical protein